MKKIPPNMPPIACGLTKLDSVVIDGAEVTQDAFASGIDPELMARIRNASGAEIAEICRRIGMEPKKPDKETVKLRIAYRRMAKTLHSHLSDIWSGLSVQDVEDKFLKNANAEISGGTPYTESDC